MMLRECIKQLREECRLPQRKLASEMFFCKTIKEWCENSTVGEYTDWRVPTLSELRIIYDESSTIGGFKGFYYWTSTVDVLYYYQINFLNGSTYSESLFHDDWCRCVRSLP